MVTSNKFPDKKVVKMSEHKNNSVVPQRTLLGEVNEHITCPLCRGYYIDATTIVECLHSFCRSCIIKHLQVKSYCPVCGVMINSAKPNIKLDKALQDIVYKLVPGLFQKEMDRRQQFYASRPGPAATATPEQRGEDTERIIFSPEDVISFSLEYADMTDADSISSKSSDSNEPQAAATSRRYLQCPAVVNISHLKKFLSMKFDIDSTQFAIDILYKRVPLPDYYTLMDIAYIYNWKRNEPMRFFYQIIDYVAIRNRLFDINRKESHLGDRKPSPTSTEDTNISSPAHPLNDHGSEASSGTDSPMPDDTNTKQVSDLTKTSTSQVSQQCKDIQDNIENDCSPSSKSNVEDDEKSQFLNSFELTAKNNCANPKTSPGKASTNPDVSTIESSIPASKSVSSPKVEETLKRKNQTPPNTPEIKKMRMEIEKAKINFENNSSNVIPVSQSNQSGRSIETLKIKDITSKCSTVLSTSSSPSLIAPSTKEDRKDIKQPYPSLKQSVSESVGIKRNITGAHHNVSPSKRKHAGDLLTHATGPSTTQKTVSPIKIQVPRLEAAPVNNKVTDVPTIPTPTVKKIPDLKPSNITSQSFPNKQPVNKIRMDLLANNSDIDRSKILPQVKSPIGIPNTAPNSGDPLKSLFDSCKINIPSSLSITLTDQKLETRISGESVNIEQKKSTLNKNLTAANNPVAHKVPSPPVHNYIQILKLPDTDSKKSKPESSSETKQSQLNKTESSPSQSKPNKSSEISAKGPIPNLKPIADTKLGKQSGNFSAPITFQQTFEQQLQTMQSDKKSKLPKNKPQVPKLVPATPKALSAANKPNMSNNKPNPSSNPIGETKTSSALDLSTSHSIQSQLGPQQTFDKAFETMQSIANLAKKQNLQSKGLPLPMPQSSMFSGISNRPLTTGVGPLRIPSTSTTNQIKHDKLPNPSHSNSTRQEVPNKNNPLKSASNTSSTVPSSSYPVAVSHNSSNTPQPSPRSQTRSPSSSPKLVIAEEKQVSSCTDQNIIQPNQMLNSQLCNIGALKSEPSKTASGPSKSGLKPVKPLTPTSKMPLMRQPQTPSMKPNPMLNTPEYQDLLRRHQIEMNNWIKVHQRHYDMYKNTLTQPAQNDFSNKDKQ